MATKVKVIADSITRDGLRITTFELEYPRMIHAEFMTHRVFSRNASSSRAIPCKTMIKNISNNKAWPTHWGKDMKGMQAQESLRGLRLLLVKYLWAFGISLNLFGSRILNLMGLHKQLANRNTEYASYIKVVMTTTDMKNFIALRCHEDAQPEIRELAEMMRNAFIISIPEKLGIGEWHTPYIEHVRDKTTHELYYGIRSISGAIPYRDKLTANQAKKISVSCCAQVSYRTLNTSIEKATAICDRLAGSVPVHASPFEHIATPAPHMAATSPNIFSMGITGYDNKRIPVSGNSVGWIQYRHCLDEIQLGNLTD